MEREELIKIAEQLINNGCSEELKAALVKEYPELAMSEDEKKLEFLVELLREEVEPTEDNIASVYEWVSGLISLHTDSGWKPSSKQMQALNSARINADLSEFEILDSLYSDLSKLT